MKSLIPKTLFRNAYGWTFRRFTAATVADERFCFLVEWYDQYAALVRPYQLMFYPKEGAVEMFDIKTKRIFLKKTKCDGLKLEGLFLGATVDLFSRQIKFTDYGDEYTRSRLSQQKERTLGIIKPDAMQKVGQIIDAIFQSGFRVTKLKMCRLSRQEAGNFYQEHQGKTFFDQLLNFMTSGPVVAFELMGTDAVSKWREMMGPTDSAEARKQAPAGLRARFGKDTTENAVHGSDSLSSAAREIEFFFPCTGPVRENTAKMSECTCCVIKPHAVLAGNAGKIISAITDAGFEVSGMQMFHMEKANAEEFYEVYKGVVQEYSSMVGELTSGPCIALEVRAKDAAVNFRQMTGPADPEIARHLRPRTLRALFGQDKVKNAVHCTDLPEDGQLEVEYFFRILDR